MTKVSVIVPVYNAEKTLRTCVESILKQDFRDFEVILVNDGSRDASQRILSDFERADGRVRPLNKENGGVSSARNAALDIASGEYIMFADADDRLPMEAMKLLVRELERLGTDMAVGDFFRVFEGKISRKGSIARGGVITRDEYAAKMMQKPADLYYGVLWNKLYRRDLIEKHRIRMEENVSYGEDMIFNLEYLLHVRTVAVLKSPVYYYVRTPGSLVERNVSLNGIVRMKRTVMRYYDRFYKKIFDERTYQERRPVILGYYLAFSTDSLTLPVFGGSKNLGTEGSADVPFAGPLRDSLLARFYLGEQLMNRYLETIGGRRGISLAGMRILYLLRSLKRPCTMEEICAYLNMNRINITMVMVHLTNEEMVVRAPLGDRKRNEAFLFAAEDLEEDLARMEKDYMDVCFEDIGGEEKETYLSVSVRMMENIRRHIARIEE